MTLNVSIIILVVSLLVGVGLIMQTLALYRTGGKFPDSPLFFMLSTLDTLWFFVCGLALYFGDLTALQKSVPTAFLVYSILSFFYASANIEGMPTRPEDIVFAKPYMNFGFSFALVFVGWTTIVLIDSISPLAWLGMVQTYLVEAVRLFWGIFD